MKLLPIKFHVSYIFITMLIGFFGPKVYDNYNKPIVFLFIFAYLLVVYSGFYVGFHSSTQPRVVANPEDKDKFILNILRKSIVISLILSLVNSVFLYSTGQMSFSLADMGANYSNFYEYYGDKKEESAFTFELFFLLITGLPKFLTFSLGFFYYNKLQSKYKRLFITFLILTIVTQTISLGNQKSLGDIVIFGSVALLVKATTMTKSGRKKLVKRIAITFVGLFIILSYSQYTRLASRDISLLEINENMVSYAHFDRNHMVFKLFGDEAGLGIANFVTGYLSNGYYGLSKTLEMPYVPTYGLGSSVAISSTAEKIFGVDIYQDTYLNRMEKTYGIPGKRHWHTIFPWLASDFTFIGTLILFYIFSYLYGKSWREVLLYKNPISLLLFSLLTVMFAFVPANNQIFHGYDYLIVSIVIFVQWFKKHKRYNIKNV